MNVRLKYACLLLASLLGTTNGWSQATIGSDKDPEKGVLLDLSQNLDGASGNGLENAKKGVIFPRVKLQGLYSLAPLVNYPTPKENSKHKGVIVYNITANKDFKEEFYYWDGVKWNALLTEIPRNSVQLTPLSGNQTTVIGGADGSNGITLNFDQVTIPEDGSYAFSFRLIGKILNLPTHEYGTRCVYYISLWENNTLKDIAEINLYAGQYENNTDYSYSVTLAADLAKGSNITFKLGHVTSEIQVRPWTLYASPNLVANRTTMIWWKL